MNPTLAFILKDTYSTSMLKHRLRILKDYLLQNYFGEQGPKDKEDFSNSLSPEDETWLKALPESFLKQFNKDNVYKRFEELEKSMQSIPVLTVYLSFEPQESVLSQIGSAARNLFGPDILIEVKLDLSLIAGCALGWKGVMRDYSLKSKIEAKKGEILESFKKFLRTGSQQEANT